MLRKLERNDYKNYIELLSQLTTVGNYSENEFISKYNEIEKLNSYIQIWVLEVDNKIIGTGTLLIEPKFIHNCSFVGHIEDVVIDKQYRKKGYGKVILDKLVSLAKEFTCYKIILNCSLKNKEFYEKSNFEFKNIEMSKYLN